MRRNAIPERRQPTLEPVDAVVGGNGLVGIVDITDVCRALIDSDVSAALTPTGEQTRVTADKV